MHIIIRKRLNEVVRKQPKTEAEHEELVELLDQLIDSLTRSAKTKRIR